MSNKKAFTLVEVLIGVVLGTLALVSIGLALDSGIFSAVDDRSLLYSQNALREELETVRRMNFDTFVALGATSNFTNAQLVKLSGAAGTRSIADTTFGPDIRKLTLTVSWNSRNNRALNQSLTTYITRRGLNGA